MRHSTPCLYISAVLHPHVVRTHTVSTHHRLKHQFFIFTHPPMANCSHYHRYGAVVCRSEVCFRERQNRLCSLNKDTLQMLQTQSRPPCTQNGLYCIAFIYIYISLHFEFRHKFGLCSELIAENTKVNKCFYGSCYVHKHTNHFALI